jgi:hypothetical protein
MSPLRGFIQNAWLLYINANPLGLYADSRMAVSRIPGKRLISIDSDLIYRMRRKIPKG